MTFHSQSLHWKFPCRVVITYSSRLLFRTGCGLWLQHCGCVLFIAFLLNHELIQVVVP